jgi:5-methyltetrahydropteroyltriglutamate--homocysteine methyltransferase
VADSFKYHADHVGSLLKPPALGVAAAIMADAAASPSREEAEDAEIAGVVALQRDLGLSVITDGELRRPTPLSVLVDAVQGLKHDARSAQCDVTGPLRQTRRLTAHEVGFLKGLTSSALKIALPSPGMIAQQLFKPGVSEAPYQSVEDLGHALAAIIRAEIEALIAEGIRYIQIDTDYGASFKDSAKFERMLAADIEALRDIARSPDVCLALYVGRGKAARTELFDQEHLTLTEKLLGSMPVDRFLLEVDDAAMDFSALRLVPKDRVVALGLISTRTTAPEAPDAVLDRIDLAAEHMDADNLALCPQTGFAYLSNLFSASDQKRKLELTVSAATRFWGFGM